MVCDPIASIEVHEHWCVELSAIIADQDPGNAKPADNVFEHEFLHLSLGYGSQRFRFGPLSEVVHGYDCKFELTPSRGERADQVNALLGEWPRAEDRGLCLGWDLDHVGVSLTFITPMNKLTGVPDHRRPVVTLQHCSAR